MLKYSKKVSIDCISIEEYNKELEVSEKEIELGNFYTHDQVRKKASQWEENNLVSNIITSVRRRYENIFEVSKSLNVADKTIADIINSADIQENNQKNIKPKNAIK